MGGELSNSGDWIAVASGVATNFAKEPEGDLFEVRSAPDALALMDQITGGSVSKPIVLIHEAGGTTVGPLLEDVGGVISTKGTLGAHVALLAKEYGCPCIVGAEWTTPAEDVGRVRLAGDGTVWALTKDGE